MDTGDPKILDDKEKFDREEDKSRAETVNTTAAKESETMKDQEETCEEESEIHVKEINVETLKRSDGGEEVEGKGAENGTEEEGQEEEKTAPEQEELKDDSKVLESIVVQDLTETTAIVQTECETKDNKVVAEVEAVIENGVDTHEEEEENEDEENVIKCKTQVSAGMEVVTTPLNDE